MVIAQLLTVSLNGVHQVLDVLELPQVQVYQVLKQHVLLDMTGKLMVLMPQLQEINMEYMICPVEPGNM